MPICQKATYASRTPISMKNRNPIIIFWSFYNINLFNDVINDEHVTSLGIQFYHFVQIENKRRYQIIEMWIKKLVRIKYSLLVSFHSIDVLDFLWNVTVEQWQLKDFAIFVILAIFVEHEYVSLVNHFLAIPRMHLFINKNLHTSWYVNVSSATLVYLMS